MAENMAGTPNIAGTEAQSGEGYAMDVWDYKTVGAPEGDMVRVLAQEGSNGWECLGITVRQSTVDEYLLLFRRKKTMMGI
jgi:hypothetical protein